MKKRIFSLLVALLMLAAALPALATAADPTTADTGLDVVIVIDRSGTMKNTDPTNIALEAAKMFIDRCNLQDNSVAIVAYGYDVIFSTDFIDLSRNVISNRAQLKMQIDSQVPHCGTADFDSSEDTNTGAALRVAYQKIADKKAANPDSSRKSAILVVSDGKIDIGDSAGFKAAYPNDDGSEAARLTNESVQASYAVAAECAAADVPICCLGLYSDDANLLGSDMSAWAQQTRGMYRTTSDVSELAAIIREFYLYITGNPPAALPKDGKFDIGNNVLEANIEILSLDSIADITLTDPNGNVIDLVHPDGASVIVSEDSRYYKTIKLVQPISGTWKIEFKQGYDDLEVTITYNLDLSMDLQLSQTAVANESDVTATLNATRQNQTYHDPAQPAILNITCPDGTTQSVQMNFDFASGLYLHNLHLNQIGDYTFRAQLTTQNMTNVSEDVTVTVMPRGLSANGQLPDYTFSGRLLGNYEPVLYVSDLATLFNDPDQIGIDHFEVTVYPEYYVSCALDEAARTLTLNALDEGISTITVTAIDRNGGVSDVQQATIEVINDDLPITVSADAVSELVIKAMLPEKEGRLAAQGLSAFFSEPNAADGQSINNVIAFSADAAIADCAITDDALYVRGVAQGETTVTVTATSTDGSSASFGIRVTVKNLMNTILLYAGIALAAILLIAIIVIVIYNATRPAYRSATLTITVSGDDGEEIEGIVSLRRYGKKKVKLSELIRASGMFASGLRRYTEKIVVSPRKGSGITVSYNRRNMVMKPFDVKTIELDAGGEETITLEYQE